MESVSEQPAIQCLQCKDRQIQCVWEEGEGAIPCHECASFGRDCTFEHITILVMGPRGAGKTSFIYHCLGRDVLTALRESLLAWWPTGELSYTKDGRVFHFVDTPGCDAGRPADGHILTAIQNIELPRYSRNGRIEIVYLHPINGNRFSGFTKTNLARLQAIVGEENTSKIVLATTKWDAHGSENFDLREEHLRNKVWAPLTTKGCRMFRLDGTREKALLLLDNFIRPMIAVTAVNDSSSLRVRQELIDEEEQLSQSTPGRLLGLKIAKLKSSLLEDLMRSKKEIESNDLPDEVVNRLMEFNNRSVRTLSEIDSAESSMEATLSSMLVESRDKKKESRQQSREAQTLNTEDQESIEKEVAKAHSSSEGKLHISQLDSALKGAEKRVTAYEVERDQIRREQLGELTLYSSQNYLPFHTATEAPLQGEQVVKKSPTASSVSSGQESLAKTGTKAQGIGDPMSTRTAFQADLEDSRDENDEDTNHLKSNTARTDARNVGYDSTGKQSRSNVPGILDRVNDHRRPVREERMRLRDELYKNSWLVLSRRLGPLGPLVKEYENRQLHMNLYDQIKSQMGPEADPSHYFYDDPLVSTSGSSDVAVEKPKIDERLGEGVSDWQRKFRLCLILLRNIGHLVWINLVRLEQNSLIKSSLSVIMLPDSSKRILELRRIDTKLVRFLVESLEGAADAKNFGNAYSGVLTPVFEAVRCSGDILPILEPSNQSVLKEISFIEECCRREESYTELAMSLLFSALSFCESALERLDMAILSFEGGHMKDLPDSPETLNPRVIKTFNSQFWYSSPGLSSCVMRLPLKCLAPFLDYQDVWVFCDDVQSATYGYYLSTNIDTFADVWRPVWKVLHPTEKNRIIRYNVGGGSIVPWPRNGTQHPPLAEKQRLCHWTNDIGLSNANEGYLDSESSSLSSSEHSSDEGEGEGAGAGLVTQDEWFTGSEALLIGAKDNPRLEWHRCHCSSESLKRRLKEAGRLSHILTSKSYRYVDAQQSAVALGSHGVQFGRNKTYKDIKEEPLKIGLLSIWENEPQFRNPREFENFWGIAISLCTMNARRVRMTQILGEDSILLLLKHFNWSDQDVTGNSQRRRTFFRAVRSSNPQSLGNLWDANPSWREDIGSALLICLRVLARTGYDKNRLELNALWLPPGCHGPRKVTLKPEDQTWTRILKDNTYSMTVAVIVDDKLGDGPACRHRNPRWFRTPSVLETAISVNRALGPVPGLLRGIRDIFDEYPCMDRLDRSKWKHVWDVSGLDNGEHFWIGPEDRLRVLQPLSRWHLLLEVDTVKRAIVRDWIGMQPSERLSHWEYTDEEAESTDVRPIPVHIIS